MAGPSPQLVTRIGASTLALFCPAKINLALRVGPRDINGMHPLVSWMVPIAFGDALELTRLPEGEASRFNLRFADDAPVRSSIDWALESDLAFRAHALLERAADRRLPIAMQLNKRIPAGAGLGGGSANAAAMLDGLNQLFDLGYDDTALASFASEIGSDVIFQLAARQHTSGSVVSGTGEKISPLPAADPLHLILVFPGSGVACNTAEVYRTFDEANAPRTGLDPDAMMRLAMKPVDDATLFNDLEAPAIAVQPVVGQSFKHLRYLDIRAHVTGSGSTLFIAMGEDDFIANELANQINKQTSAGHALATHTLGG